MTSQDNTPASEMCKCGHSLANHWHDNAPIVEYDRPGGPCQASVVTTVPNGANVTRCKCRNFAASPQAGGAA